MIGGEAQGVEIKFSKQQAPYVRERTWRASQSIETKPNGSVILRLRVTDLREVKRWLIGFGADTLVLKPAELRHEIASECTRMSKRKVGPK
jgi:predicted DNA-binding transcriptional regulator YafY